MHRYSFVCAKDADYIVLESWAVLGHYWIEHARWMIPGSQLED